MLLLALFKQAHAVHSKQSNKLIHSLSLHLLTSLAYLYCAFLFYSIFLSPLYSLLFVIFLSRWCFLFRWIGWFRILSRESACIRWICVYVCRSILLRRRRCYYCLFIHSHFPLFLCVWIRFRPLHYPAFSLALSLFCFRSIRPLSQGRLIDGIEKLLSVLPVRFELMLTHTYSYRQFVFHGNEWIMIAYAREWLSEWVCVCTHVFCGLVRLFLIVCLFTFGRDRRRRESGGIKGNSHRMTD